MPRPASSATRESAGFSSEAPGLVTGQLTLQLLINERAQLRLRCPKRQSVLALAGLLHVFVKLFGAALDDLARRAEDEDRFALAVSREELEDLLLKRLWGEERVRLALPQTNTEGGEICTLTNMNGLVPSFLG